jgi:hypothetical protein
VYSVAQSVATAATKRNQFAVLTLVYR